MGGGNLGSGLGALGGAGLGYALAPATGGLSIPLSMMVGGGLGSAAGGLFDNQSGTSTPNNEYEAQLAKMAQALFDQTAPMRGNLVDELTSVSNGTYDPQKSPLFSPRFAEAKQGVEDQYGIAKQNIMSNTPRGGALASSLNNLEMTRAGTAARMPQEISSGIMNELMNKAYGTAFNTPAQSMQGMSGASQSLSGRQSMAMQADAAKAAAKKQAQGQAIGGGAMALGYGMGGAPAA